MAKWEEVPNWWLKMWSPGPVGCGWDGVDPAAGLACWGCADADPAAGSAAWLVLWTAGVGVTADRVAVFAGFGWLLGEAPRAATLCGSAAGAAVCGERVSSRPAAAAATITSAAGSAIITARRRWARTRPRPPRPETTGGGPTSPGGPWPRFRALSTV